MGETRGGLLAGNLGSVRSRRGYDLPFPLPKEEPPMRTSFVCLSVIATFAFCGSLFRGGVGPAAPRPCPPLGWSASNALEVIIQP